MFDSIMSPEHPEWQAFVTLLRYGLQRYGCGDRPEADQFPIARAALRAIAAEAPGLGLDGEASLESLGRECDCGILMAYVYDGDASALSGVGIPKWAGGATARELRRVLGIKRVGGGDRRSRRTTTSARGCPSSGRPVALPRQRPMTTQQRAPWREQVLAELRALSPAELSQPTAALLAMMTARHPTIAPSALIDAVIDGLRVVGREHAEHAAELEAYHRNRLAAEGKRP